MVEVTENLEGSFEAIEESHVEAEALRAEVGRVRDMAMVHEPRKAAAAMPAKASLAMGPTSSVIRKVAARLLFSVPGGARPKAAMSAHGT